MNTQGIGNDVPFFVFVFVFCCCVPLRRAGAFFALLIAVLLSGGAVVPNKLPSIHLAVGEIWGSRALPREGYLRNLLLL